MKRKFLPDLCTLTLAAGCLFIAGCKDETVVDPGGMASVAIERVGQADETEFTVKFVPSEGTSRFIYAIGSESDRSAFEEQTLENIASQDGGGDFSVTFSELHPRSTYTVFARAFDSQNIPGTVSSIKVVTFSGDFSVTTQYVSDCSAGFTVLASTDYYKYRYLLGTAADRDAFLDGTNEGTVVNETTEHTYNFFDLTPSTEYVLYVIGYDRSDKPTKLYELAVPTPASDACANAKFQIDHIDIYNGRYSIVPNSLCGQIVAVVSTKGEYDEMINSEAHWKGDITKMLTSWAGIGMAATYKDGTLEMEYQTPALQLENPLEAYVMICDKNYQPAGIKRFDFATPSRDDNAGEAAVSVTVSNITASGATYTYTPNDNTLGFLYDTVDADWFDEVRNSPDYYDTYLHEQLLQQGRYWSYGHNRQTFTESTGEPGKRYYAAACPMNLNGPQFGWGPLTLQEYTTLPE